jgi:pilus assembly protein CpaE
MAKTPAALVIDADIQSRFETRQVVRASGLTVAGEAGYGMEAITTAQEVQPDVIFVGVNEPMERPLQTLEQIAAVMPDTPLIVVSDSKEIDTARKAMLAGARDFLTRPVKPETLRQSVLKAMEAEENRRLRKTGTAVPAATQGTVVTVFGAKGGIGKSTIATNLAVAMSKQANSSVVIVDLDNGFGDVTGMLDVKPEKSILDLIRDIDRVEKDDLRKYLAKHELSGLDVLSGPGLLEWRKLSVDDVRRAIDLLTRSYDTVVLDTSGLLNDLSEMAIEMGTIVLWVTTTEFASVKDSLEALKALSQLSYGQDRIRIVTNAITADDGVRPAAVEEALQRDVFWSIPYDKRVRQGTHLGQPIVITSPQSVAAKSFSDLATLIAGGRLEQKGKIFGGFRWRGAQAPAPAEGT